MGWGLMESFWRAHGIILVLRSRLQWFWKDRGVRKILRWQREILRWQKDKGVGMTHIPLLSISPGQQNWMKTYHNWANYSRITKIAMKIFLEFLEQSSILQPKFRNKTFSNLNLSKNGFNKSWCPKLILFYDFFLQRFGQFLM